MVNLTNKILIILGPTSTGKTDLALQLASKFQGELVSADSRQVYRGLDIGTGKLPSTDVSYQSSAIRLKKGNGFWEIDGITIWMYDVVDPRRQYTVFDYVKDAGKVIRDIWKRGKPPIIVGGTGLYLKALIDGLPNLAIPVDWRLREELTGLSLEDLQKELQGLSSDKWKKLNSSDKQNPRRLIRAIELATSSLRGVKRRGNLYYNQDSHGPPLAGLGMTNGFIGLHADILKIGLTAPREILYQRIDERVVGRIKQGMIDEVRKLHQDGLTFRRMRQLGLEYGILADFLSGRIREIKGDQGLVKIMQGKIHGFARRQITWFKKEKNVFWFDITDKNYANKVENLVAKWYDTPITYATKN